ncbi:Kae1-like domain-containing protein, partial [Bacillus sp. D-CC]
LEQAIDINNSSNPLLSYEIVASNLFTETCKQIRQETGINKLVLSGGVFLNKFLLVETYKSLKACKFEVYMHKQVPTKRDSPIIGRYLFVHVNL